MKFVSKCDKISCLFLFYFKKRNDFFYENIEHDICQTYFHFPLLNLGLLIMRDNSQQNGIKFDCLRVKQSVSLALTSKYSDDVIEQEMKVRQPIHLSIPEPLASFVDSQLFF